MQCNLYLMRDEAVVGKLMREITTHMLADKAQVKGLKVSEMVGMEQYGKGYDFTVRHT